MRLVVLAALALAPLGCLACDRAKAFVTPVGGDSPTPACAPAAPASALAPGAEAAVSTFLASPRDVREVLSRRVHGERPTPEDARLLLAVCANLHDDACVADCQLVLAPPAAATPAPAPSASETPNDPRRTPKDAARRKK